MKKDLFNKTVRQHGSDPGSQETNKPIALFPEPVVICDECGDSLWDAVLEQEYPVLKFAEIIF